jgi:hypothetical protein
MNYKWIHAKLAKKDAKRSDLNFAFLGGFSSRPLREILK